MNDLKGSTKDQIPRTKRENPRTHFRFWNLVLGSWNFQIRLLRTAAINLLLVAVFIPVLSFAAVEWAAYQATRERQNRFPVTNSVAWLPDDGPGYNPENMYWVVEYDCRQTDVVIEGIVPPAKYWSMVPYDRYTMPLSSFLTDETVQRDYAGRYVAYLTAHPHGRTNEINVSASPRGLLLIRILLPDDPQEVAKQAPVVRPVAAADSGQ